MPAQHRLPVVRAQQLVQPVAPPDRPLAATLLTWHRRPLAQPVMWARLVVVSSGDGDHVAQVRLADDQQTVKACLAHGADPTLGERVRPRSLMVRLADLTGADGGLGGRKRAAGA